MDNEKKIALVLSGGGIRGIAHAGVIQALEENGIKPDMIAGASAGAIVGALYAKGYAADDILKIFQETELFSINHFSFGKPGLINTEKFIPVLEAYLDKATFEDLNIPLFIAVTNLVDGNFEIASSGDLIQVILASAAYPGIFSPVEIDGILYADGGILNNFPVEAVKEKCDILIGIDANPIVKAKAEDLTSTFGIVWRAIELSQHRHSAYGKESCDVFIMLEDVHQYGFFNTKDAKKLLDLGYREGKKYLAEIQSLLRSS